MSEYFLKIDDAEEQKLSSIEKANSIFYGSKEAICYEITSINGSHKKTIKGIRGMLVSGKDIRKMFGTKAEKMLTEQMRKHPDKLAILTADKKIAAFQDYNYLVDSKTHISRAFVPMSQALEKKRKKK